MTNQKEGMVNGSPKQGVIGFTADGLKRVESGGGGGAGAGGAGGGVVALDFSGDHFNGDLTVSGSGTTTTTSDGGSVTITGGMGGVGILGGIGLGTKDTTPGTVRIGSSKFSVQVWASEGGYTTVATSPEVEELKKRIEELEEDRINREGVEYFKQKLHGALKIPPEVSMGWKLDKVIVGPNDILLVHFDVTDIPRNRVEGYMRKAKSGLATIFEERGLKGRTLWIATRDSGPTRFSVIGITREPKARVRFEKSDKGAIWAGMKEATDYARKTRTWESAAIVEATNELQPEVLSQKDIDHARAILRKQKYPPPVMG